MASMKISRLLWVPTVLIIVVLLVMGTFATVRTTRLIEAGREEQQSQQERLALVTQWSALEQARAGLELGSLLAGENDSAGALKRGAAQITEQLQALNQRLTALAAKDTQQQARLAAVSEKAKQFETARTAALSSDPASAIQALSSAPGTALAALIQAQREFAAWQVEQSTALQQRAASERFQTTYTVLGVMGLVAVLMCLGSWFLVRTICTPLRGVVETAQSIGQGDLTVHIDTQRGDELGQVLSALAQMRDSLGTMVGQVRRSTDNISVASSEVAMGNQDLSSRTEQAAANLQTTASSLEELTATVAQSADAARQANQLATSASEVAQRGGSVVSQVVATMEDINNSSKKIADIISVIDGIAFQTNILALNAAVEAARAGEQGRGFAVVASEVRSLASRSAEAAKEIKSLISASVERVETGSRLVRDAGATMHEIVSSVQRVSDMIGEITTAAAEQSGGISQVNESVSMLDQMTQQNAALVEEGAAAAESLKEQAVSLAKAMERFKLAMS
jgi:methyl-accepting chemotaxis protein